VTARVGVITFPGSLDDRDAQRAVRLAGGEPVALWHADADLQGVDAVVLPGGFSYGDYLRAGALARFAPAMGSVVESAGRGLPVLGICNGFQVLCESGLLPGCAHPQRAPALRQPRPAAARREHRHGLDPRLRAGQEIVVPVKNGEGSYVASADVLDELEASGRVVARYLGSNPNGSLRDIAGIRNERGNVVGIMPHPEHAVEELIGTAGTDGLGFFTSVLKALVDA
jgi:phosphoribosylformylglycinamidine synthase